MTRHAASTPSAARLLGAGDRLPRILVRPPGPRSRALARRLERCESPGVNTVFRGQAALAWSAARGANVLDLDGNRFIDLAAGFGAAAVGHANPQVVAAVRAQARVLLHGFGDVHGQLPRVALAERLCRLAPVDQPQVYFAVTGSEAVEIALKTALLATGRPGILAFEGAYHGLTLGALAVTARPEFRLPFAAHLTSHVERLPFASSPEVIAATLRAHTDIGCVLVEPILGREGIVVPPRGWLRGLAAECRRRRVLLIADEIFTGCGRTGRMFAVEHERVRPDLLCCGKALAGGMPLAAVIGRRQLMSFWATSGEALHTGTFVAHPVACTAALAVLDVLRSARLIARATHLGRRLALGLKILARQPGVLAVRGRGSLWAIEMVDARQANAITQRALERGVILLCGGPDGRVLQIAPPMVISDAQLSAALEILSLALTEVAGE